MAPYPALLFSFLLWSYPEIVRKDSGKRPSSNVLQAAQKEAKCLCREGLTLMQLGDIILSALVIHGNRDSL